MSSWFQNLKRMVLNCFFPNRCPFCGEVIGFSEHICENCRQEELLWKENGAFSDGMCDKVIFCFPYDGKARDAVLLLKHHSYVGRHLAYFLYEQCDRSLDEKPQLIVPVPMAEHKKKERGYNQAEVLAKELSDYLKIPFADVLLRENRTAEQHTLSRIARQHEVEHLYFMNPANASIVSGKDILLVDDIYTTGNTAKACAKVLKIAGAKTVTAAVICKTFRRG